MKPATGETRAPTPTPVPLYVHRNISVVPLIYASADNTKAQRLIYMPKPQPVNPHPRDKLAMVKGRMKKDL